MNDRSLVGIMFVETSQVTAAFNSIYPCKVGVEIEWPLSVQWLDGRTYWKTGKVGVRALDDMPTAEYQYTDDNTDSRVWLDPQGSKNLDD